MVGELALFSILFSLFISSLMLFYSILLTNQMRSFSKKLTKRASLYRNNCLKQERFVCNYHLGLPVSNVNHRNPKKCFLPLLGVHFCENSCGFFFLLRKIWS